MASRPASRVVMAAKKEATPARACTFWGRVAGRWRKWLASWAQSKAEG